MEWTRKNWSHGTIELNGKEYRYSMKHFSEPSEDYGINGGRISKLDIRCNEKILYNYDRGLDIAPKTADAEIVLNQLLDQYN